MDSTQSTPQDDWRNEALCAFYGRQTGNFDLWFPEDGDGEELEQQAKTICGNCPVRQQCLRWVFDHPQNYGIFGGLTPADRRKLERQARNGKA